jgi:DMSO/TMAO reductase YedYZ molybdopterin-dependent catalytic subunit
MTFHGEDGYSDETCRDNLLAADVLLATFLDGKPLTLGHGGPLRLVTPAHCGYKRVKHLTNLELRPTTQRRLPWWSSHHPWGRRPPWLVPSRRVCNVQQAVREIGAVP